MLINRTGTFRGLALESQVGLTKKGFPQFVFRAQATEWYDTETGQWFDYSTEDANEITGYLVLFSADGTPIFHIKDIVETFKWDGQTMGGLDAVDISKIPFQFTVEENLYNEVTSLKVCKIAPFDAIPGGSLRKLDPASLKALDAKFAASLLKNAGGKKPVSAPAKKPTMPTPPTMNAAPAVAEPTGGVGSTDDPAPVTTPPAAAAATPPKRTRKPKAAKPYSYSIIFFFHIF